MVVILFYFCCNYDRNADNAGPETLVLAGPSFCGNYIFQGDEDYVDLFQSTSLFIFHSLSVIR